MKSFQKLFQEKKFDKLWVELEFQLNFQLRGCISRAGREDQNLSYTYCLHPPPQDHRRTRDPQRQEQREVRRVHTHEVDFGFRNSFYQWISNRYNA